MMLLKLAIRENPVSGKEILIADLKIRLYIILVDLILIKPNKYSCGSRSNASFLTKYHPAIKRLNQYLVFLKVTSRLLFMLREMFTWNDNSLSKLFEWNSC